MRIATLPSLSFVPHCQVLLILALNELLTLVPAFPRVPCRIQGTPYLFVSDQTCYILHSLLELHNHQNSHSKEATWKPSRICSNGFYIVMPLSCLLLPVSADPLLGLACLPSCLPATALFLPSGRGFISAWPSRPLSPRRLS